jgi:hypothetical protein
MTVIGVDADNAGTKIFRILYFVGCPLGFNNYVIFCYIFLPRALGERQLMTENEEHTGTSVIVGEDVEVADGKKVEVTEEQKNGTDSS